MTGKRIRRVSLYVTIFFLALAVLNLYKSKDNTITGTDDLKQYDMSAEGMGEDSGVKLIDSKDYVFEKEYNIASEEKAVVKSEEKDVKEEKVAEKKKPEAPKSRKYVVKRGDSIYTIAKKNGIKVDTILDNNPSISKNLSVGQKIILPNKNGIFYTVKRGDDLSSIAKKFGVKNKEIVKTNVLTSKKLKSGQKLFIENPNMNLAKKVEIKKMEKESKMLAKKSRRDKQAAKIFEEEKEEIKDSGIAFSWPCKWKGVSSPFGSRLHPVLRRYIFHEGVDLQGKRGDAVSAAKSGTVIYSGWMSGYGKLIIIDHGNGYTTRYGHLNSISVEKGAEVSAGDYIGEIGSTGRSTGPHLHFEIRKNGRPVDPLKYR